MVKDANSARFQRGLVLLGLMTAVVITLGAIVLRGARQEEPTEKQRPDLLAAVVASAAPGLSGLSLANLEQLGQTLPSAPGWQIRYQAATTLARLGSPKVPFGILAEMLDEGRQMRNRRATLQDGREVPDEAAARGTVLIALRAVSAWYKHRSAVAAVGPSDPGLRRLDAAIEKLTHSPNLVVRTEAEKTRLSIKQG